ncbi:hypothetical protein M408DRAFT_330519 [Serendipita vermifera MAFF 305830]|uniref:DUF5745 domain-containing protein n=1 Tax=Serendipita vermifera MAFF 305830 TaxID=933852 RepID=A0A0C2XBP2_SERVB|nr:hypothetical protein M408DRAFT_330519 [Serendipita vermifera MAFF 305830]
MENVHLNSDDEVDELVGALNILLDNLDIPIELESPYDLTPSLLLAVLESTLQSRLPLSDKLRQAHSPQSKVEAVKVFLGVLGNDILKLDLSDIEPRRLARGEWEEVVYVGTLLVRVAKQVGVLEVDAIDIIDSNPDITTEQAFSKAQNKQFTSPNTRLKPSFSLPTTAISKQARPPPTAPPPIHSTPPKRGQIATERSAPRPPARESTPPPTVRKTLYMGHRPAASPSTFALEPSIDGSVCSCAFEEDVTGSTAHCHCEVHGSETETSAFDTSADLSLLKPGNVTKLPVNILTHKAKGRSRPAQKSHLRF